MAQRLFLALAVLCLVTVTGPSAWATSGEAIAFAHIDGSTGDVLAGGGSMSTGAATKKLGPGTYQIEFLGKYAKNITADRLIILASPKNGSGTIVFAAGEPFGTVNSSKIVIAVQIYQLTNGDNVDRDCYVAIFLGNR